MKKRKEKDFISELTDFFKADFQLSSVKTDYVKGFEEGYALVQNMTENNLHRVNFDNN